METAIVSRDPYLTQEPAGNQWESVAGTEHGTLLPRNNRNFIGTDRFLPGVFDLAINIGLRVVSISISIKFSSLLHNFKMNRLVN